jgi:hypothetical protein
VFAGEAAPNAGYDEIRDNVTGVLSAVEIDGGHPVSVLNRPIAKCIAIVVFLCRLFHSRRQ